MFRLRLITVLLSSSLWGAAAALAQGSWEATTDQSQGWLKLSVPEALYQSLGERSLQQLRIQDAQGQTQAFAVCSPPPAPEQTRLSVPVLALNVGSRASLDASGRLVRQSGPGVEASPPWTDWVLDLRPYAGELLAVELPAALSPSQVQLRSSPGTQQWSRPIAVQAQEQELSLLNPEAMSFLRLDLEDSSSLNLTALNLVLSQRGSQVALHWFDPGIRTNEVARVRRPYGVQGARLLEAPTSLKSLALASRLNSRDAWKSRGQWQAGGEPAILRLAAVGDQEWQLRTQPQSLELAWELGHAAHEIRLPSTVSPPLLLDIGTSPSQQLACDDRRWKQASRSLQLKQAPEGIPAQSSTQTQEAQNIRPWFLVIVAVLAGGIWWSRRQAD